MAKFMKINENPPRYLNLDNILLAEEVERVMSPTGNFVGFPENHLEDETTTFVQVTTEPGGTGYLLPKEITLEMVLHGGSDV